MHWTEITIERAIELFRTETIKATRKSPYLPGRIVEFESGKQVLNASKSKLVLASEYNVVLEQSEPVWYEWASPSDAAD